MPETADALIVAITGHKAPDSAELARAAGFDHYLVKPVKLDAILETVGALTGDRGTAASVMPLPCAAGERAGPTSA